MFLGCPGRTTTRVFGISKRNRGKSTEDLGDTENRIANKIASSTTARGASSSIKSIRCTAGRKGPPILCTHEKIRQKFEWTEEVDTSFAHLKKVLSTPPVLVAPKDKEPLLLYSAAAYQVVSTVLVVEQSKERSKVLSPSKQCYPHYQKLAYSMFMTA
jgi:hypothetical protein